MVGLVGEIGSIDTARELASPTSGSPAYHIFGTLPNTNVFVYKYKYDEHYCTSCNIIQSKLIPVLTYFLILLKMLHMTDLLQITTAK